MVFGFLLLFSYKSSSRFHIEENLDIKIHKNIFFNDANYALYLADFLLILNNNNAIRFEIFQPSNFGTIGKRNMWPDYEVYHQFLLGCSKIINFERDP